MPFCFGSEGGAGAPSKIVLTDGTGDGRWDGLRVMDDGDEMWDGILIDGDWYIGYAWAAEDKQCSSPVQYAC